MCNVCSCEFVKFYSLPKLHFVQMSPSKLIRRDSFSQSGERIILQKLEEVGSSVKVETHKHPFLLHLPPYSFGSLMYICTEEIFLLTAEGPDFNWRATVTHKREPINRAMWIYFLKELFSVEVAYLSVTVVLKDEWA